MEVLVKRPLAVLVGVSHEMKRSQLTDGYTKDVCLAGQGHLCCRYLTMGADGWDCQKFGGLRLHLDQRVEREEMVSRGDNCDGVTHDERS